MVLRKQKRFSRHKPKKQARRTLLPSPFTLHGQAQGIHAIALPRRCDKAPRLVFCVMISASLTALVRHVRFDCHYTDPR